MSALRLFATDVALAARCERQFLLSREGMRVVEGGAGLGSAAHAILSGFVERGAGHPRLSSALAGPLDEASLTTAASDAVYAEFFAQAGAIAPRVRAVDLVALGNLALQLGSLLAALLVRARRSGLSGDAAFARALTGSERPVSLATAAGDVEVTGVLDLLCRDLQSGELYVVDLKTGLADSAAEEQVRLYALALARAGEPASAALVHVASDRLQITRVDAFTKAEEAALEGRLERLRRAVDGEEVPAPARDPSLCRACPVQRACWSRWGKTLEEAPAPPAPAARASAPAAPAVSDEVRLQARRLERALRAHRVPLAELDPEKALVGPSVVRFRARLREGARVATVERIAADLQRELGWQAAPLVENGPDFVCIDAPRAVRETLAFAEAPLAGLTGLQIPVGVALDRTPITLDLAEAPHLLVAGSTGSGKTVFLQSLVLSLLDPRRGPPTQAGRSAEVRAEVVIIDPKAVDFVAFDALPLAQPVITDPARAVTVLRRLADEEMPARTLRLQEARVANRRDLPDTAQPMPPLLVVVDEFADLLISVQHDKEARSELLGAVQRLLQRARNVGIHLVLATQRPSVDALPGMLKVNLPVRIAFRLPDANNSRIVLDASGAEVLLGKGDLLLKTERGMVRGQGWMVTGRDVQVVADGCRPGPRTR